MVRRLWRVAAILTFVIGCTPILLSTCTAPTQPTNQAADLPPADLHTSKLAHLHQAAHNYARYHALALRQSQDRPPDDLLGLKRLTEVCAALEEAGVDDESCREATEMVLGREGKAGGDSRFVTCNSLYCRAARAGNVFVSGT